MTKETFEKELRRRLGGLPQDEVDELVAFRLEMIDDMMAEEGLTEDQALSRAGSVDKIAEEILSDIPLTRIVREKAKPKRRMSAWEIVLLAAGSPVWLALLIAVFAVVLSLYVSLWAIVVSLWAIFASFVGGSLGGLVSGIIFICGGNTTAGLAMIAAALVLAGLAIFLFYGCRAATKGTVILAKKIVLWTKKLFIKKENLK